MRIRFVYATSMYPSKVRARAHVWNIVTDGAFFAVGGLSAAVGRDASERAERQRTCASKMVRGKR